MGDEQVFVDIGRFIAQQNKILSDKIDSIADGVKYDIAIFDGDINNMQDKLVVFYDEFYARLNASEKTYLSKVTEVNSALSSINTSANIVATLNKESMTAISAFNNRLNIQDDVLSVFTVTMDTFRTDYKKVLTNLSLSEADIYNKISNTQTTLETKINLEKSRIDSILSLSEFDKDSFKEIVEYIKSIDTTNNASFIGYVTTNNARSTTIENSITTLSNNIQAVSNNLTTFKSITDSSLINLTSKLVDETARIDAILNASSADKDSFKEVVDLINSIDLENDASLASYIANTNSTLSSQQNLINNRYSKEQADARFLGVSANAESASKLLNPRKISLTGDISGLAYFDGTSDIEINIAVDATTHNHDLVYLGINSKAVDSDKFDGLDSTQFLRKDVSDTINGDLTINSNNIPKLNFKSDSASVQAISISPSSKGLEIYKSSTPNDILFKLELNGMDSLNGFKWNGQSLDDRYLGKFNISENAKLLDGFGSSDFVKTGTNQTLANTALNVLNGSLSLTKGDGSVESVDLPVYTHPKTGVVAGTYTMVTVDENGHILSGTKPTTLSDLGISNNLSASDVNLLIDQHIGIASDFNDAFDNAIL